MPRGHAEALPALVQDTMQAAGLGYAQLQRIVVTVGPGSFTGLRVGLAFARGISVATRVPCVGVTTLACLAHQAIPVMAAATDKMAGCVVVLNSKRQDPYYQVFDCAGQALTAPSAALPADLVAHVQAKLPDGAILCVGDFPKMQLPTDAHHWIDAETVMTDAGVPSLHHVHGAVLAQLGAAQQETVPAEAVYVRPPDAAIPKNGGRLRPAAPATDAEI
jgi:tRNA threonylcarbamoyladenosine biosynthesis protein TsaB